ncbi:MAG TPA: M48 family metalloprotease [Anaeromyxobacteraceae bacterium]|jgi:Zn-dependent protease with chaperone function
MPGRWADLVAQSAAHALVAALVVEALVRAWGVARPAERQALRLVALAQPLVVTPLLLAAWPGRAEEAFLDGWALLVGRRWDEVRILRWSAFDAFAAGALAAGALLFAMDLVPLLRGRRRRSAAAVPAAGDLAAEAADLCRRAGRPVAVRVLDLPGPAVWCAGVRRPAVLISRGALELLDPAERRAALAHEIAHVARRDPLTSWGLFAARAALFFNPVAQVLGRAAAREAERRADDLAGELCGDRLALASALLKLHRAGAPPPRTLPFGSALAEPLRRARSHDAEVRCRRLLDGDAPPPAPLAAARLALAAAALPPLLALVA